MNEIATSLGYVFWGLLVVILDVSLNQFDILPDFFGYLLVAGGLGGLLSLSARFATARACAWVLVPVSLVTLFPWGRASLVMRLIPLTLHCVLMWSLLGGIMDYAAARDRPDLVERASNRRVVYVSLIGIVTLFTFIGPGVGAPAALVTGATGVCVVVMLVMILHLIHRVKTEVAV